MADKKTKKPAKIASTKGGDVIVAMSERRCEHCSELIPTRKIFTVKRITVAADGKSGTRSVYFDRDHYKL